MSKIFILQKDRYNFTPYGMLGLTVNTVLHTVNKSPISKLMQNPYVFPSAVFISEYGIC